MKNSFLFPLKSVVKGKKRKIIIFVLPLFLCVYLFWPKEGEEISPQYVEAFWEKFLEADLEGIRPYYAENILLLRNSLLRSSAFGLDENALDVRDSSQDEVFTAYSKLKNHVSFESFKRDLNRDYTSKESIFALTRVKDTDPRFLPAINPSTHYIVLFLKPSYFFETYKIRDNISPDDFVLMV